MTATKQKNSDTIINKVLHDAALRKALTTTSHYWFFHTYFSHYVKYPTAEFHKEMFRLTEDEDARVAVIVAFRGSAKSTIMTLSYPVWAILGAPQKKFALILSKTQQQARLHFTNLRRELESNEVLKKDLGPFREEKDEWGSYSLVLTKHNARITAASSEQSIRGLRHGEHRPDLIICDDVEDLQSVKTREGRKKTYDWFTSEVVPTGDTNTKIVLVGNLLHEDSLLMHLKEHIENDELNAVFKEYPLMNDNGVVLWPGKFTGPEVIEAEKKKIGGEIPWQREYLLKILPDHDQVVHPDWIQYYDELPKRGSSDFHGIRVGVDLAISKKSTADYTAMVSAKLYEHGDQYVVYILPDPVNERLTFPETIDMCKALHKCYKKESRPTFIVEEVGYQKALTEALDQQGLEAIGISTGSQDKRTRLSITTHLIQSGQVLFPRKGAEQLIMQLVGFGVEKHDDLADSFALLLLSVIQDPPIFVRLTIINYGDDEDGGVWRRLC